LRLIDAVEELATIDEAQLDEVTAVLVARVLGDESKHADAMRLLQAIPPAARWIVELVLEVELEASRFPLRHYPSGIRGHA